MANTDQIQANWFVHTNRCSEDVHLGKFLRASSPGRL